MGLVPPFLSLRASPPPPPPPPLDPLPSQLELKTAHDELIVLRKTHDRLYQDADAADVAHRRVCEELSQLERLAGVGGMGGKGKVRKYGQKRQ